MPSGSTPKQDSCRRFAYPPNRACGRNATLPDIMRTSPRKTIIAGIRRGICETVFAFQLLFEPTTGISMEELSCAAYCLLLSSPSLPSAPWRHLNL
jgi:hypothetical protein